MPTVSFVSWRMGTPTLSFCLVSSEMLPLGESSVGVGGVTVISGGNLVTVDGMKSFGMLGGIRERILLGSGCFGCWLLGSCWSEEKRAGPLASPHSLWLLGRLLGSF